MRKTKLLVEIPIELKKRVSAFAIQNETSMKEIVIFSLNHYLKENEESGEAPEYSNLFNKEDK